ncbi:winged helix-turn-helix transcriptional regulator [Saccharopolyspora sp. NPDC002376]
MITQRLRELEREGLADRVVEDAVPPRVSYHLSAEGRSLAPVLQALYDWGEQRAASHDIPIERV